MEFPKDKKYQIIYADPPWKFSSKELQKYDGGEKGKRNIRFTPIEKHYPTQEKDWIKRLPVKKIADINAALFIWSTDAHLKEAIETMEAWGFKFITVAFVWEKITKKGKTISNLGAWTLKNYELCLLGTKGGMLKYKKRNDIPQKIAAIRTKHSHKPSQARKNIESLFGDLKRIELFAREKTIGWDAWGNQVNSKESFQGPGNKNPFFKKGKDKDG